METTSTELKINLIDHISCLLDLEIYDEHTKTTKSMRLARQWA